MTAPQKASEWDVLKRHHRFVRDQEDDTKHGQGAEEASWEERLARTYESKLFREFALIDLKHYKSKQFALRWRTATEVVNGIGEDTCGSLRCRYHAPEIHDHSPSRRNPDHISLRAFELPFSYEEGGKRKETLVKVKLCSRCQRKLLWKPEEAGSSRVRSMTDHERSTAVKHEGLRRKEDGRRRVYKESPSPEQRPRHR